jgi:hypothetical protein
MKMVGLHALSHLDDNDDHDTHCEICNFTITHNLTPALAPEPQIFSIENTELVFYQVVLNNYTFINVHTIYAHQLFSRPPPYLA